MFMRTGCVPPANAEIGAAMIRETAIPASLTLPGCKRKHYPIDIREFLSNEDNAFVSQ